MERLILNKVQGYHINNENYEELLDKFYEENVEIDWFEQYFNIDVLYREKEEAIKKGIISDFENGCKKFLEYKKDKKIKYIQISFLRTNIIEGKGDYRIDFFDAKWYGDKDEFYKYIKFDFVFEHFFKFIDELRCKAKKYYNNKITEMDIERISMLECNKYNILVGEYLKEIVKDLVQAPSYIKINKDDNCLILVGEYMGEFEIIYPINQ